MDTLGQASALTGGYGNSYASTAGNQAYQGYLTKLNDVVPQLYQMAYDKYDREGQDLYNQYNMVSNAYNQEYGQYRDALNDWNNNYNRLNDAYNTERSFDYGQYSDAYGRAWDNYQFNNEMALKYAQLNKGSGNGNGAGADDETGKQEMLKQLENNLNYSNTLIGIGDGIQAKTIGQRGNTANGGYTFQGTTYRTKEDAELALAKYLDSRNLTTEQINSIYEKLGL